MNAWLTVIGVGLASRRPLSDVAESAIVRSDYIAGANRLLSQLDIDEARQRPWPTPFNDGVDRIVARRGEPTVVLASGDPMHFGIGATLAQSVPPAEMLVLPAPSAFSLAAARMGWPLQDVTCRSAHGRDAANLLAALYPGARLLLLTSDGETPAAVNKLLVEAGFAESRVTVLENLGGTDEGRHDMTAAAPAKSYAPLNIMAIECVGSGSGQMPHTPGLPDDAFEHDGQLTKRDVRTLTIMALAPLPGQHLWDVGAGSGSIAIEWMRHVPGTTAAAYEYDERRIAMIESNRRRLGTPGLAIVPGKVPDSLTNQRAPDAVFHGGAVSSDAVFAVCWTSLKHGGRFVSNAVTLEGEAALVRRQRRFGGDLVRLGFSHVEPVGEFRGMRPAMSVMQWRVRKT